MRYLQMYENFDKNQKDETLYIFDFDDTIVDSPRFEELAIEYLKESETIGTLLQKSVNQISVTFRDLKVENGRLYVNDPDEKIKIKGNWVRKKKRVYLVAPDRFYFSDLSLPKSPTKLSELYNQTINLVSVRRCCLNKHWNLRIKDLHLQDFHLSLLF